MNLTTRLVYWGRRPFWGLAARFLLKFLGVEIPRQVVIGKNLRLPHRSFGTVIHVGTRIGDNVTIFHGVTLGRADAYREPSRSDFRGIEVEDDVVIGAGAAVLCKRGVLTIGRGSIIGANAVLLNSTGPHEVWAGNPATLLRKHVQEPVAAPSRKQPSSAGA